MASKGGECLLAREVNPTPPVDSTDDALTAKLAGLTLARDDQKDRDNYMKNFKAEEVVNPADFVALQSIRSSAIARKNTTSKFCRGGEALFNDLLNESEDTKKDESKQAEEEDSGRDSGNEASDKSDKESKTEKSTRRKSAESQQSKASKDEEEVDDDLISRGPVRTSRPTVAHHPYHVHGRDYYGTTANTSLEEFTTYSVYGAGYECGANAWQDSPETSGYHSSSSTPETHVSDAYRNSVSPAEAASPQAEPTMSSAELNRLLSTNEVLPDPLVDFILSYSRQYGKQDEDNSSVASHPARPPSADSIYADSPLSAISAPHCSPGQPHAGFTGRITPPTTTNGAHLIERPARHRLRAEIEKDLDAALLWICKCIQVAPGALTYQDPDQDSLLHIVLQHNDVPKAYAVIEQQLKLDYAPDSAPFDLKNRNGETPLMLAVERRNTMFVQYLLEVGADPNRQPIRGSRDGPLHYAAGRGLTDIVAALVHDKRTSINKTNGLGQSPLQMAVRHHGVFDEETKKYVDNFEVMKLLIESGADPLQVCSTDGKTILHYAVEKCDASIVDHLRKMLSEEIMTELANKPDFNHEVPIDVLEQYKGKIDEGIHSTVFFALLTCGASVGKSPSPTDFSPCSDA